MASRPGQSNTALRLLRRLTPPVVTDGVGVLRRRWKRPPSEEQLLFDGAGDLFIEFVADAKTYGEYGCGRSTIWVLNHTSARVVSAETDADWMQKVRNEATSIDRLTSHVFDLGPLGAWGRPVGYSHRQNFKAYAEAIWSDDPKPDTVLVDGRFRVLSFLTCLMRCDTGTRILFDDYTHRPHYHIVEEVLEPEKRTDRQALFVVPPRSDLDTTEIQKLADKFEFVLD